MANAIYSCTCGCPLPMNFGMETRTCPSCGQGWDLGILVGPVNPSQRVDNSGGPDIQGDVDGAAHPSA